MFKENFNNNRKDYLANVETKEQMTISMIETKKLGADISEFENLELQKLCKQLNGNITFINYIANVIDVTIKTNLRTKFIN